MSTTTRTASSAAPPTPAPASAPDGSVRPPAGRRPGLLVAGAGLAILGGLGAASLAANAGGRHAVVVLARDVGAGQQLAAEDLTEALVAVDAGVAVVPADQLEGVVGQVAGGPLPAGSVLAPGNLVLAGPPGPGEVVVPLPVAATVMPAAGLEPGDQLLVVDTPLAQAEPTPGDPQRFAVQVVAVGPPDVNGVRVVDVVVADDLGPEVAKRAATGRFVLMVLPAAEADR